MTAEASFLFVFLPTASRSQSRGRSLPPLSYRVSPLPVLYSCVPRAGNERRPYSLIYHWVNHWSSAPLTFVPLAPPFSRELAKGVSCVNHADNQSDGYHQDASVSRNLFGEFTILCARNERGIHEIISRGETCISRGCIQETGRIRAKNEVIVFIWREGERQAGRRGVCGASLSLSLSRLLDHCYPIELLLSLRFQLAGVCYWSLGRTWA